MRPDWLRIIVWLGVLAWIVLAWAGLYELAKWLTA